MGAIKNLGKKYWLGRKSRGRNREKGHGQKLRWISARKNHAVEKRLFFPKKIMTPRKLLRFLSHGIRTDSGISFQRGGKKEKQFPRESSRGPRKKNPFYFRTQVFGWIISWHWPRTTTRTVCIKSCCTFLKRVSTELNREPHKKAAIKIPLRLNLMIATWPDTFAFVLWANWPLSLSGEIHPIFFFLFQVIRTLADDYHLRCLA